MAQLSLSLVLLLAASLSVRALQKAAAIDLGFNPRGLLTAAYDLTLQNYPVERREVISPRSLRGSRALPDVASVTLADVPPLSGTMVSTIVTARHARGDNAGARAYMSSVGASFFRTLEIPLVRGRGIDETRRTRHSGGGGRQRDTFAPAVARCRSARPPSAAR